MIWIPTGYKHFRGQVLEAHELKELFDSLKLNKLHYNYTHLLTGKSFQFDSYIEDNALNSNGGGDGYASGNFDNNGVRMLTR